MNSCRMQQAEAFGGGGLLGGDNNMAAAPQGGAGAVPNLARELQPTGRGGGSGPGTLGPRAPTQPGFTAFAGEGQRLG